MSLIWTFLNSKLGIAIVGATLLEYIRQRYQRAAKENAQKVEWLKQTKVAQTKVFNELSNLTASIVAKNRGQTTFIIKATLALKRKIFHSEKYTFCIKGGLFPIFLKSENLTARSI